MLRESFVQSGINAVVGYQFVVRSVFDDSSMIENEDLICVADGAQSMRDDKSGAAVEQDFQRILQSRLGSTVDAAGGFIQNQNCRVRQHGSCETDELPLTGTHSGSAFTDSSLKSFRQRGQQVFAVQFSQGRR